MPIRGLTALLSVGVLTASGAAIATGQVPSADGPIDPAVFIRIEPNGRTSPAPALPKGAAAPVALDPIGDFVPDERSFAPRPAPELRQPVGVIVRPTPRPRPRPQAGAGGTARASGVASWYCKAGSSACHYQYPGGMYAAAGPALRVGDWRGRSVRVCGNGGCVTVQLIDWCACPGSRVIDLYSDAFRRLAPLSAGTVRVAVSW